MKRRLLLGLVALASLFGCSPSVNVPGVTVHIPDVAPAIVPDTPGVHLFYSELAPDRVLEEFDRAVKMAHPRYGVRSGQLQSGSNNLARILTRRLSNGRTMLLLYPHSFETERQAQSALNAFTSLGVLTDSGLEDLQPVAVDIATVNAGGEVFRFYSGSSRDVVMSQAQGCRNDFIFDPDMLYTGGMSLDATAMPDIRVRFYVDLYHSFEDLAGLRQLQSQVGLLLACLDARIGPGQEA